MVPVNGWTCIYLVSNLFFLIQIDCCSVRWLHWWTSEPVAWCKEPFFKLPIKQYLFVQSGVWKPNTFHSRAWTTIWGRNTSSNSWTIVFRHTNEARHMVQGNYHIQWFGTPPILDTGSFEKNQSICLRYKSQEHISSATRWGCWCIALFEQW